ncbi:hypothetical protein ACLOJK_001211, partial [Asimina triloba]
QPRSAAAALAMMGRRTCGRSLARSRILHGSEEAAVERLGHWGHASSRRRGPPP